MNELSLYILDLVQNSVTAGAKHILISVSFDTDKDTLTVVIEDDGCGMSKELLQKVTSPFTTTRKTRKVGLGIPMIMQLCEMCEGRFSIQSEPRHKRLRPDLLRSFYELALEQKLCGKPDGIINSSSFYSPPRSPLSSFRRASRCGVCSAWRG